MTAGRRRILVNLVILDLVIDAISYRLLMNSSQVVAAQVAGLKHHPHNQVLKNNSKSDPISDFA